MDNAEQTLEAAVIVPVKCSGECMKADWVGRIKLDEIVICDMGKEISLLRQQLAVSQAANKIADSKERQLRLKEASEFGAKFQEMADENQHLKMQLVAGSQPDANHSPPSDELHRLAIEANLVEAKSDVSKLQFQLQEQKHQNTTLFERIEALKGVIEKLRQDLQEQSQFAQSLSNDASVRENQVDNVVRAKLEKQIETLLALHDKDQLLIQHNQKQVSDLTEQRDKLQDALKYEKRKGCTFPDVITFNQRMSLTGASAAECKPQTDNIPSSISTSGLSPVTPVASSHPSHVQIPTVSADQSASVPEQQMADLLRVVDQLTQQVRKHEVMYSEWEAQKHQNSADTPVSTLEMSVVEASDVITVVVSEDLIAQPTVGNLPTKCQRNLSVLQNKSEHALTSGTASTASVAAERLAMLLEVTIMACSSHTGKKAGVLPLSHCNITDSEIAEICSMLLLRANQDKSFCLRELNLRGNRITDVGARHVALLLSHKELTRVDLRENTISHSGALKICSALIGTKRGTHVLCEEQGLAICGDDVLGEFPLCTVDMRDNFKLIT